MPRVPDKIIINGNEAEALDTYLGRTLNALKEKHRTDYALIEGEFKNLQHLGAEIIDGHWETDPSLDPFLAEAERICENHQAATLQYCIDLEDAAERYRTADRAYYSGLRALREKLRKWYDDKLSTQAQTKP